MIEIVCEIGINANGDLEIAKKLIDVASAAGCHYIKLQKRDVNIVYTKEELDKPRESPWGTTTREQKEGLEFGLSEYGCIDAYCYNKKIKWFASPWDSKSLHFIDRFDISFIKIPSALITNEPFLEVCRDYSKQPFILSTGMSTLDMVDRAIDILGQKRIHCIMACTSTYPTEPNEVNIECIHTLQERYSHIAKIGFSNHYPGLMAMTMAATVGTEVIELHVTLDRASYGSDQAASIEPQGVFRLMEYIRLIEQMKGDGVKRIYESEQSILTKLRRQT